MPHIQKRRAIEGILWAKRQGITPLQYMLAVLGQRMEYDPIRFNAAVAAAPYVHPRLAAVAVLAQPDPAVAQRRDMLKGLNYQQRRAIEDILAAGVAAAQAPDDGTEIEGAAEPLPANPEEDR